MKTQFLNAMSKDAWYQLKVQLFPSCSASWHREYLAIWAIFLQVAKNLRKGKNKQRKTKYCRTKQKRRSLNPLFDQWQKDR